MTDSVSTSQPTVSSSQMQMLQQTRQSAPAKEAQESPAIRDQDGDGDESSNQASARTVPAAQSSGVGGTLNVVA